MRPLKSSASDSRTPIAEVADAELVLERGDHPAHDVLVDLVDEEDEAEHPHRLGEEPDEERSLALGDRLAGRLVGRRRGDVGRQAAGDDRRRAGLVVGVEVDGRRISHGGRFCTMGAISWPSAAGWSRLAPGGMLGPWSGSSSPWCWPSWPWRWRPCCSGASGPPRRSAPGTRCPAQVDRADFARPEATVARRRVHLRDVRLVRRRVGAGPAPGERRRRRAGARAHPGSGAPRPLRDRGGAGHARRRRARAWWSRASSGPVTATDSGLRWPRPASRAATPPGVPPDLSGRRG